MHSIFELKRIWIYFENSYSYHHYFVFRTNFFLKKTNITNQSVFSYRWVMFLYWDYFYSHLIEFFILNIDFFFFLFVYSRTKNYRRFSQRSCTIYVYVQTVPRRSFVTHVFFFSPHSGDDILYKSVVSCRSKASYLSA